MRSPACPRPSSGEKPGSLLRTRNQALLTAASQLMPMTSHHIVERVPKKSGYEPCHPGETPSTSKVLGHPQSGCRSREQPFLGSAMRRLVPHHRIHSVKFGVPRENGQAEGAVEGRESQGPPAIVPEDELHAVRTESTGAIVEQDRSRRFHRPRPARPGPEAARCRPGHRLPNGLRAPGTGLPSD
jgi:hypothetical protein